MRCARPGCRALTRVIDETWRDANAQEVSRRRECVECRFCFTTCQCLDPETPEYISPETVVRITAIERMETFLRVALAEEALIEDPDRLRAIAEMNAVIRAQLGESQDLGICEPHLERKKVRVPAVKIIAGTGMCTDCWAGLPLETEPLCPLMD